MPKVSKQPPAPASSSSTHESSKSGGHGSGGGQNPPGLSPLRPMRLKVLYSLDESLPNCLARAKDVAQVRVAHLDGGDTPIGLVDLKTCVLNIAYSSPEILHHQGFDYSVYAFDYSEPDTPLIGLGLLSWVLSLPSLNGSQPPSAESLTSAQANRLVTGRVQKSLLGLFAGDVRETLEVRMRLCRVPALKQSDYVSHMNQLSSISKNMPQGMDVASWWTNSVVMGGQGQIPGAPPRHNPPIMHSPMSQGSSGHYSPYGQPPPGHPGANIGPPHGYHNYPPPYPHGHGYQHPQQQPPPPQPPHPSHQYGMPPSQPPPQHPTNYMPPPPPSHPAAAPPTPPTQPAAPAATAAASTANTNPPPPAPAKAGSSAQTAPPQHAEANDSCTDDQAQPPTKKRKTNGGVKRSNSSAGPGRPRKNPINNQQSGSEAGKIPSLSRTVSEPAKQKKSAKSPAVPSPALSVAEAVRQQLPKEPIKPPPSAPSSCHLTPASQPSPENPTPECLTSPPPDTETVEPAEHSRYSPDGRNSLAPPPPSVDLTKDENIVLTPVYSEHENTHTPDEASDVDSLFIGSSPPPTITEEVEEEEEEANPSPPGPTSPAEEADSGALGNTAQSGEIATTQVQKTQSAGHSPADIGNSIAAASKSSLTQSNASSSSAQGAPAREHSVEHSDTMSAPTMYNYSAPKPGDYKLTKDKQPIVKKRGRGRPPLNSDPVGNSDAPPPSDGAPQSDAAAPPLVDGAAPAPAGDAAVKRKRGRLPGSKKNPEEKNPRAKYITKERIARQMRAKIAAGELPNHCEHCGAIETPTWRKAKVVTKDPDTGEEKEHEVQLCNPCGLWEKNHKTMRPEKFWESPSNDQPKPTRKPRIRKKKTGDGQGGIPSDPAELPKRSSVFISLDSFNAARDISDRNHKSGRPLTPEPERSANKEWKEAINRSLRRIQSSPMPMGTSYDPINLVSPSLNTRRVLFPSAKKSSKGLDGKGARESARSDLDAEEALDKENLPPSEGEEMDWEEELARVLQEANTTENKDDSGEFADGLARPTTPTPQAGGGSTEFKTPVKFTPGLGSLPTGSPSPWRSSIFASFTPGQLLATPNGSKFLGTPPKLMSPASGEIMLELINEWTRSNDPNTSPRARENVNMTDDIFTDLDFPAMGDSLLTSDQPMPSSPPPLFAVYDEAKSGADGTSSLWSDIIPTSPRPNVNTYSLDGAGQVSNGKTLAAVPEEADGMGLDLDTNLVVDFSDFVATTQKLVSATAQAPGTTVAEKISTAEVSHQSSGGEKSSSEDD